MNIYITLETIVGLVLTAGIIIAAILYYLLQNWPEIITRAFVKRIRYEETRTLCLLALSGRPFLPAEITMELVVQTLKNSNPYGIICEGIMLKPFRISFRQKMDRVIVAFYEGFLRKLREERWPELPTRRELEDLFIIYKINDRKKELRLQQVLLDKLLFCILQDISSDQELQGIGPVPEKRDLAEWVISHCKSHILCGYEPQELRKEVLQFQRLTETRIAELKKLLDIKIA
jgi:hypothetical protein